MSDKLALSTDAPFETVLELLQAEESVGATIVENEGQAAWLLSRNGQRLAMDYGPKGELDEMETFISVDASEPSFQSEVFALLHTLPYECRSYDELDNETTYRPENALPAEPWTPS